MSEYVTASMIPDRGRPTKVSASRPDSVPVLHIGQMSIHMPDDPSEALLLLDAIRLACDDLADLLPVE